MFEKWRRPGRSRKEGSLKKLFSYIIFGTICLVFVFLAPVGSRFAGESILGYVGKVPIRAGDIRRIEEHLNRRQNFLEKAEGEKHAQIKKEIRKQAIQQFISSSLIDQGAQKNGFFIGKKELIEEIRAFPDFQKDGQFLYSKYLNILKSQRLKVSRFENLIRKDKLVKNWIDLSEKAIFSNKIEKKKQKERQSYKTRIRYAPIPTEKAEEESLKPLVQKGNLKKINEFLKEKQIQWEEPAPFSIAPAFRNPIVQNQNLMEALIHHLPSKGLIPRWLRQNNKIYIIQVLSFKKENMSPQEQKIEKLLNQRFFDKSVRFLDSWLNFQKQRIKVEISDSI